MSVDLFELGLNIKTTGDKEAKAALQSVDQTGKAAANGGLAAAERAHVRLGESAIGSASEMKKLGRELTASAGEALGMGKAAGSLGASLGELGPAGLVAAAGLAGLAFAYRDLNRSSDAAKEQADSLTLSLSKQKQAADAATVAGARLALQQQRGVLAEAQASSGPGLLAGLKVGLFSSLGGLGIGAREAGEESIASSRKLRDAKDAEAQAVANLAKAEGNETDAKNKAIAANISALSTLVRLGNATAGERAAAIAQLAELKAALNALPVSDTIGRAGLAGQIKELNDALFPKLHEHVKKLGRELSELAKAPKVSITPSRDEGMASAQNGGVVSTETIFGKMGNIKENPATKVAVEGIHTQTEEIAHGLDEQAKQLASQAQMTSQIIGDALQNGFADAFNGGGVTGFIEGFGKTVLAAIGQLMVQQGESLIAYGITMSATALGLSNPFTAGPAAIAAGIALTALGAAMGAAVQGHGSHGASYGGSNYQQNASDVTRLKFIDRLGNPSDSLTPARPVYIEVIGEKSAKAQRVVGTLYDANRRRRT